MGHVAQKSESRSTARFLAVAWLCFLAGGDDLGNRVAQGLRRIPVSGELPAESTRLVELAGRGRSRDDGGDAPV